MEHFFCLWLQPKLLFPWPFLHLLSLRYSPLAAHHAFLYQSESKGEELKWHVKRLCIIYNFYPQNQKFTQSQNQISVKKGSRQVICQQRLQKSNVLKYPLQTSSAQLPKAKGLCLAIVLLCSFHPMLLDSSPLNILKIPFLKNPKIVYKLNCFNFCQYWSQHDLPHRVIAAGEKIALCMPP